MSTRGVFLGLALGLAAAPAWTGEVSDAAAVAPDLAALIECRADYPALLALLPVLEQPLRAVALGWRPQAQSNAFMIEYRLNAPISVFGRQTDHIAFAGDAVIGVLDLDDPRTLARELALETGIDTPTKALFGREISVTALPVDADGQDWEESAILNVSNVDSHPGKTLAGCSYSRSPVETDPDDAQDPAT